MKKYIPVIIVILGLGWGAVSAADKAASDKERIAILEKQVAALNEAVATQGQWQNDAGMGMDVLNQRTIWLHDHVLALETRGPVARVQ